MESVRPKYDDTEAVWKILEQGTSEDYPHMSYVTIVRLVREHLPHIRQALLHDILRELEESGRIDASEGFSSTSEITRLFP